MENEVVSFITPHLIKNHLEIEFRIGKKNGNIFDTNIGKDNYDKCLRRLKKYTGWERVETQEALVYYGQRKGLRIVYNENTEEQTVISKYNIGNMDRSLQNSSFDMRLAVSIENPASYDEEKDRFPVVKKRSRTSFIRKGLSIDLSVVENNDKDSENPLIYQLELEIIQHPSELDNTKIMNHFAKVNDVLKLLV